ncbi:phage integrase family protein [Salmonella enterica subsp. enterica]|uniref:Phage integrase family protein n=1 Tax=Salmonella enterica I TaxID=59201 RepID=A0A447N877_SALET|nr:phage integrase family protein [Salmonella enterica subsp. enterica]
MLYVYEIFYSFILSLIDCICTPIDIVANVRTCDGEYINIKIIGVQNTKMTISDTKLRSLYGKPYSGPSEITDSDLVLVWNLGQGQSGRDLKKCMD